MIERARLYYVYSSDSSLPVAEAHFTDGGVDFCGTDHDGPGFSFTLTWDDLLALCHHHTAYDTDTPDPAPEPAK